MEVPLQIYEESTIAFIDILGFKNALKDEDKAKGILDALSHISERVEKYYSDPIREQFKGVFDIELTAFSDSIVISGSESQAIVVLFASLEFSRLLIEKGFLCRGGVASGKLHHKKGILFGDSFVKAYELESKQAIYPRIILDDRTLELINESKNSPSDFEELIKSDKDGCVFLNVLYQTCKASENTKGVLSELVQKELSDNSTSANIKQKLLWLQNEYSLYIHLVS